MNIILQQRELRKKKEIHKLVKVACGFHINAIPPSKVPQKYALVAHEWVLILDHAACGQDLVQCPVFSMAEWMAATEEQEGLLQQAHLKRS